MSAKFQSIILYMKQRTIADYSLILTVVIVVGAAIFHFQTSQVDDAFITYRYANSIATGQGFSYNPFESVLGTTTPLYTLVLALAGFLSLPIPTVSLFLNGFSLIGLALTLYFFVTSLTNRWVSGLAAISVILLPGSYMMLGMETLFYAACIYAALVLGVTKNHSTAAIFAALATLLRYDGALVAGVVLLNEWIETRRLPWKNGILYGVLLLPWLLTATWLFGSPLPNTFAAKAGYFEGNNPFLNEFPDYIASLLAYRWFEVIPSGIVILTLLFFIMGIAEARKEQRLRLIAGWVLLYILAYTNLRLGYVHPWYYYPILPGSVVLVTVGVWVAVRWLKQQAFSRRLNMRWLAPKLGLGIATILLALVVTGGLEFWQTADTAVQYGGRYRIYTETATWLCQNTQPEATVAVPEIGIIGWHCPRKIIDPYGLVTPQMIPYVRDNNRLGGVAELQPDYIVLQDISADETAPTLPEADRFYHRYKVVKTFAQPDFPQMIVVFEKQGDPT